MKTRTPMFGFAVLALSLGIVLTAIGLVLTDASANPTEQGATSGAGRAPCSQTARAPGCRLIGSDAVASAQLTKRLPMQRRCSRLAPHIDLHGCALRQALLARSDLRVAQFYKTNLRGANFKGANLKHANFKGANLSYAKLDNANLDGANLKGAILKGTSFKHANLDNVVFAGATKCRLTRPKGILFRKC